MSRWLGPRGPEFLDNGKAWPNDDQKKRKQEFCEFGAQSLDNTAPDKAALLAALGNHWDTRSNIDTAALWVAIRNLEILERELSPLVNAAVFQKRRVDATGTPRQKVRVLEDYIRAVRALGDCRATIIRQLGQIKILLEEQGYPDACVAAIVVAQMNRARGAIIALFATMNDINNTIDQTEAGPGCNPRKILWMGSSQGEDRPTQIRKLVTKGPLSNSVTFQGKWLPAKIIGDGMAAAALWIRVDDEGVIVDRVVRKDTYLRPESWKDCTRWAGDMRNGRRVPWEFECQRALSGCPEARFVINAEHFETSINDWTYRIYTLFCPLGDLDKVISTYDKNKEYIPEPFIWLVLESLVETGLLMERGYLDDISLRPSEWMQIVHRDLKPSNIFLDAPSDSHFSCYPTPKLADFGLAFQTSENDPLNPYLWNLSAGTLGFFPPEQRRFVDEADRKPVDDFQLLAHTNVWGVGAILHCLTHGKVFGSKDQLSYLPGPEKNFEHAIGIQARIYYSRELLQILQDCLRFDPAERPTFADLHRRIGNWMTAGSGTKVREDTFRARVGAQHTDARYNLRVAEDTDYRMGMAVEI